MDLHQLPGSLYSSPQLYSVMARGLGQDPSSCSADDKMIEKLICTLPDRVKIHPFISILNMGPRFKYLPKGSFYLFMLPVFYIMQPFYGWKVRNRKYHTFFLTEILQLAKVVISKQSLLTHKLVSSLVYRAIQWQHWVGMRQLWTKKMQWQLPDGFIKSNCSNAFLKVFY